MTFQTMMFRVREIGVERIWADEPYTAGSESVSDRKAFVIKDQIPIRTENWYRDWADKVGYDHRYPTGTTPCNKIPEPVKTKINEIYPEVVLSHKTKIYNENGEYERDDGYGFEKNTKIWCVKIKKDSGTLHCKTCGHLHCGKHWLPKIHFEKFKKDLIGTGTALWDEPHMGHIQVGDFINFVVEV
jgi:hypothetical protein